MNDSIIQAIHARHTINLFDPSHTLSDEEIATLVKLATTAPSSFNLQNWRFIAVRTAESKARLRRISWDQAKITDAAVTFIVCGQLADYQTLEDRLKPVVDAGIMPPAMVPGWVGAAKSLYDGKPQQQRDEAVRTATFGASTLIQAAHAFDLGAGPMIGFDADAVSKEFELLPNEVPVMLLAVGKPLPENWPQKPRRPIDDVLTLA